MRFKVKLLAILSILTTITLSDLQAQEEEGCMLSGSLTLASDYRLRGVSQTNENPTLQGSLEGAHSSGWYMGGWGSNIGFAGPLETNFLSGIRRQLNEGTVGDIGFVYYHYPASNADPGTADTDFYELFGLKLTPENYNKSGKYCYAYADYSVSLPQKASMAHHLGYNIRPKSSLGVFGDASRYLDWSAGCLGAQLASLYSGQQPQSY